MSPHAFRGKRNVRGDRTNTYSQASTRRNVWMTDQHGRQWWATIELRSGDVVGQITPDFKAPWVPDQPFLIVNPMNAAELWIEYDAMIRARKSAWEIYHETAKIVARQRKLPEPKFGEYSEDIMEGDKGAGHPPHFIEPVIAAQQGNRWILGQTEKVDDRLKPFITVRTSMDDFLKNYDFRDDPEFGANAPWNRPPQNDTGPSVNVVTHDDEMIDPDSVEVDPELASAFAAGQATDDAVDEFEDALSDLEDEADPEALGGRRVSPKNSDRAKAQSPRQGDGSAVRGKHGARRAKAKAFAKGRKTLADGAMPAVSD